MYATKFWMLIVCLFPESYLEDMRLVYITSYSYCVLQGASTKGCAPFAGFTYNGLFQAVLSKQPKYHYN